jgi:hypothetical protein
MACDIEKIARWAKNDQDAIAMIICACANLANENGLFLGGHAAIHEAANNIVKYFERQDLLEPVAWRRTDTEKTIITEDERIAKGWQLDGLPFEPLYRDK